MTLPSLVFWVVNLLGIATFGWLSWQQDRDLKRAHRQRLRLEAERVQLLAELAHAEHALEEHRQWIQLLTLLRSPHLH
jgi:hypothetical protein